MPSVLVAGRVDSECKQKAELYIKRAGLTPSDVIRIVWGNIAETGDVPRPVSTSSGGSELASRMRELRARTPRSGYLEGLTPEGLREELEGRG